MSRNDRKRGGVEEHLSLAEAAGRMGISERTARRWIKSGKLRAYKPGRDYWIPESALRELIEESEVHPKAQASLPLEESERGVTPGSLLSAEWALSLTDEDTFQRAITNALSQDLRGLVVDLV